MNILGIDIGGTGIKAAMVDTQSGALLDERTRIDTPRPATPEAIADALVEIVSERGWTGPVGIGFPAVIRQGVSRTAANIDSAFVNFPITGYFSEQLKRAVHVANDADVAGLAEMRFGAGRNQNGVVLIITIGTGLGTALFHRGVLLPSTELGHIFLENGQEAERYASEAVRVTQGLSWKEWGERFNLYLTSMEKFLWPDLIILGGGVSEQWPEFSPLLKTAAPVVAARFFNQAGIVGAALFAREALINSPSS